MITIWPQNRCISPGLAGNRDFVFPFEWPVSCPPPSSSEVGSSKGAKLLLWTASQQTRQRICSKFSERKDIFAIAGGFWTKIIARCPPRCLVSSRKPAPWWSGGSVTTVAPPKLVPSDLKLALESFYLPWFGQKTRFCLCDHFFHFMSFFWSLPLFPHLRLVSLPWRMG